MPANLEFKYPYHAAWILPVVMAAVFLILSYRKKERIMALLGMDSPIRWKALRIGLLCLGLGLMVFSLTGPQVFIGYSEAGKAGADIYVLMDTSKSMLANDVAPDRLSVAKKIVESLLDHLDGDRIGFIPFASDAYIQMPLTDDYQLARMFLNVMDTDMISGGGTNLAAAIRLADDSFARASDADQVILILSDGEEHDGASEKLLGALTGDDLKIYTVGIGTDKGGLIPIYGKGNAIIDYMRDDNGDPVTTRLNGEILARLAAQTHGVYYPVSAQSMDIPSLLAELSGLNKDVRAMGQIRSFRHLYQYFLGPGILLFAIAWFLPERKVKA